MNSLLKGVLIHTDKFGWQVRYEFGQNQCKFLTIHHESIQYIKDNAIEGQEVSFEIKATPVKNTLNGAVSSARIIN
jgi:hypothetical protein